MHWISQKAPGGKLGGALVPRPVINTFSLNVPRSGSQGSTIFSPLWVRSAPEVDIGLELETFPSSSAPAGLLPAGKRKPPGFVGLPGEGGAGPGMTQHPAQNQTLCVRVCMCVCVSGGWGLSWPGGGEGALGPRGVSALSL